MGRKPINEKPMTSAERKRRSRLIRKSIEENRLRMKENSVRFDSDLLISRGVQSLFLSQLLPRKDLELVFEVILEKFEYDKDNLSDYRYMRKVLSEKLKFGGNNEK